MQTTTRTAVLCVLLAGVVCTAHAETINCTPITSLPAVITVQGIYCFTGHLNTGMTSGNAIEIQTNNVALDLNGWKLGRQAGGIGTQAAGIHAFQRKNITIRNGTIRGFYQGIWIEDTSPYTTSSGHLVEDMHLDANTWIGIRVEGSGNIVRRNQVVNTGGSPLADNTAGIDLFGPGARVLDNDVSEVVLGTADPNGTAFGINLNFADDAAVVGNRVGKSNTAFGNGVSINTAVNVLLLGNQLLGKWSYGLVVSDVFAGGKCRDNFFSAGVTYPLFNCANVANNN